MKFFILVFTLLLTGCATNSINHFSGQINIPDSDLTGFKQYELPVKADASDAVVYMVYTYGFYKGAKERAKGHVSFNMDGGKEYTLNDDEYTVLKLAKPPKSLNIKAACNGYQPVNLKLGKNIKLGKTYIIAASPVCFYNPYDNVGMELSTGSVRMMDNRNGKYLIYKSKQNKQ